MLAQLKRARLANSEKATARTAPLFCKLATSNTSRARRAHLLETGLYAQHDVDHHLLDVAARDARREAAQALHRLERHLVWSDSGPSGAYTTIMQQTEQTIVVGRVLQTGHHGGQHGLRVLFENGVRTVADVAHAAHRNLKLLFIDLTEEIMQDLK